MGINVKPKRDGHRRRKTGHGAELKQHALHKALIEFDDFKTTILPAIQADVKAGLTDKQMREKYLALVQARQLTDALTNPDAQAAVKDILDRTSGKATEKKEITHRLQNLPDNELDAVIKSMETDLIDTEDKFQDEH